jgi:hypothetical protein
MKEIMALIEKEQQTLEHGAFFQWLKRKDEDDPKKLAFIPAMYFYVLAFRDLLNLLTDEEDGALQSAVNAYVEEDAGHFLWYLEDMATAGFPLLDSLSIWDKRLLPSRRAIYRMIAFAMDHKEPIYRAILVTIFEATGEVFFRHTRLLMQRLGLDQQLGYFGTGHYEAEVSHSVKMDELAELVIAPAQCEIASRMVREAFAEYRGLFQCWMTSALAHGSETELFDGSRELAHAR